MTADALLPLQPLLGRWRTVVSAAAWLADDDVLTGDLEVQRLDGGLVALRSTLRPPVPASLSVVGRNQHHDDYVVLYADDRGVSRVYAMTFDGSTWTQERADPDFHQRFRARLSDDGARIEGAWEASHDAGATWEHDFSIVHERVG